MAIFNQLEAKNPGVDPPGGGTPPGGGSTPPAGEGKNPPRRGNSGQTSCQAVWTGIEGVFPEISWKRLCLPILVRQKQLFSALPGPESSHLNRKSPGPGPPHFWTGFSYLISRKIGFFQFFTCIFRGPPGSRGGFWRQFRFKQLDRVKLLEPEMGQKPPPGPFQARGTPPPGGGTPPRGGGSPRGGPIGPPRGDTPAQEG